MGWTRLDDISEKQNGRQKKNHSTSDVSNKEKNNHEKENNTLKQKQKQTKLNRHIMWGKNQYPKIKEWKWKKWIHPTIVWNRNQRNQSSLQEEMMINSK